MVEILAHRGASHAERENTVEAFRRARELGADAVELDVRRTIDDVLVVHHDPCLDDGRAICATEYAALPDWLPTLAAALDACDGMWVNVEIKNDASEPDFDPADGVAEALIRHLVDRHDDARWLISSFRRATIDRCRQLAPTIATAWLTVEVDATTAGAMRTGGHQAVHPWFANVTPGFVEDCHAKGVRVNVWTCDDPATIERLAGWGVDGICTNVPDAALQALRGGTDRPVPGR